MIDSFTIIYLLATLLQIYAIYKFMRVFFLEESRKVAYEWVMYMVYYIAITSIFLMFRTPFITIITNLVCLFLIAKRYTESYRKAILSMLYIYILLMLIDIIVSFTLMPQLMGNALTESHTINSSVAVILVNLINYASVLGISRMISVKKGGIVPNGYWISLIFLPLMTIYIVVTTIDKFGDDYHEFALICGLLLVANFIVFYLYDMISHYFEVEIEDISYRQLNSSYESQFEMMAKAESNIRNFRHDFRKHMAIIGGMATANNDQDISRYLEGLYNEFHHHQEVVTTGNIVLDSIINYELNGYKEKNIQLEFKCGFLPDRLMVAEADMTIILSNLLDNAMTAVMKIAENRVIRLEIKFDKGIFFIGLSNSYDGQVRYKNGRISTRKKNNLHHGLGLGNVGHVVDKYNGSMRVYHDQEEFSVEVVIYAKPV